jgi:hypothetical protein
MNTQPKRLLMAVHKENDCFLVEAIAPETYALGLHFLDEQVRWLHGEDARIEFVSPI